MQPMIFDSAAVDEVLLILKIAFLVLLYTFIWRIVRTASRDLRLPQESFVLAPSAAAGLQASRPGLHTGRLVVVKSADLERGEDFTVQGDGEQKRAFCFVDDAVAATVAAVLEPGAAGGIFNVGNPTEEASINELIALLSRVSGKSIEPRYELFAGEGTRRRLPDISRARDALGFEPRVTFEDGLRRTYDWYAAALR